MVRAPRAGPPPLRRPPFPPHTPPSLPVTDRDKRPYTYAGAGVDIAAGNRLVDAIKPAAASTRRPGADAALGGFGALFDLKAAGFSDPVLIASTDGVGTKLKIAFETGRHKTVGIDLVAMCANDVLVQGAEPLFFLDYFATGKLRGDVAADVVDGVAEGCRQAGCALIGGETAEMPGMYAPGEYDLAGFVVGAAERGGLLAAADVTDGDALIGLASGGLHSNGFSLVRKLVADMGLRYDSPAPFAAGQSLGEALLAPTRIYVKACLNPARSRLVKALAHITGGGLIENVPRCLPDGARAVIDAAAWPLPSVFAWLQEAGSIEPQELARTFNCGLGMIAVVPQQRADEAVDYFTAAGERAFRIGRIEAAEGPASCIVAGAPGLWGARRGFTVRSEAR